MKLSPFVFGAFLFSAASVHADQIYTWSEVLALTSQNNADLQSSNANLKSSEYLKDASKSGFYPQLQANYQGTRGNSTGTTATNSSTASLSLTQNVFNGLSDYATLQRNKANVQAADASYSITKAQVSYDLKTNYQSYLFSKENVLLAAEIIKRREDNYRMVELRFESGGENKGSVLLAKAYLSQAKLDHFQASNAVEKSRVSLSKVMGFDEPPPFDVNEAVPLSPPPPAVGKLTDLAVVTPQHVQAIAQEDAAEAGIAVSRSGFFPKVSLTGTVGKTGFEVIPNQSNNWSLGLSITFPLFTGLSTYYATKSSAALWTAATFSRNSVDRGLLESIKLAYNTYIEAVMKLTVDEGFRDAAQARAEIARARYNNGLINFDAWDVIENDLIARQKTYLQTKRDRVTAEANWEKTLGKGALQ